jgi:transcriptional regulator with XRE-family HTH domain
MKGFGERLKSARTLAGFDLPEDLATNLGLKAPAYRKYERGDAWPSFDTLVKISASTAVSLHWLIMGVGPSAAQLAMSAGRS